MKDDDEELRNGKTHREWALGESSQSVRFQWDRFRVDVPNSFSKCIRMAALKLWGSCAPLKVRPLGEYEWYRGISVS